MKKTNYLLPIFLLLLTPLINAGVGVTSPGAIIQLEPGQSSRFQFEIQTVLLNSPVECSITFNTAPFTIELDSPSPIFIGPGLRYQVYGNVSAPKDIGVGLYQKSYSVACSSPEGQQGGASIQEIHGAIPFTIELVSSRTRENPYVPPKPEKQYPPTVIFLILALIIIILFIVFLAKRNKKQKRK